LSPADGAGAVPGVAGPVRLVQRKERIMVYRVLPVFLVALAVAVFVGMPLLAADDAAKANSHEGKVVSVTGDKLVMTDKNGNEHSHTLATDARVTCDGKACKLSDLKPGMKIRVTTKAGDKTTAIKVEALKNNTSFGRTESR
jgi:hypothetical protein